MIFFYTHAPCYDGTNISTSLVQLLRVASAGWHTSTKVLLRFVCFALKWTTIYVRARTRPVLSGRTGSISKSHRYGFGPDHPVPVAADSTVIHMTMYYSQMKMWERDLQRLPIRQLRRCVFGGWGVRSVWAKGWLIPLISLDSVDSKHIVLIIRCTRPRGIKRWPWK